MLQRLQVRPDHPGRLDPLQPQLAAQLVHHLGAQRGHLGAQRGQLVGQHPLDLVPQRQLQLLVGLPPGAGVAGQLQLAEAAQLDLLAEVGLPGGFQLLLLPGDHAQLRLVQLGGPGPGVLQLGYQLAVVAALADEPEGRDQRRPQPQQHPRLHLLLTGSEEHQPERDGAENRCQHDQSGTHHPSRRPGRGKARHIGECRTAPPDWFGHCAAAAVSPAGSAGAVAPVAAVTGIDAGPFQHQAGHQQPGGADQQQVADP